MRGLAAIAALGIAVVLTAGCARHHGEGMTYGHHDDMDAATDRGMKEVGGLIDKTVKDPDRAARAKGLVHDIIDEAKQSYTQHREFHRKLYELNGNYDATPEEFMKILDESNNTSMRSGAKILGLRFKLKEQLTREEWQALTDEMKKYADRYRKDYERR